MFILLSFISLAFQRVNSFQNACQYKYQQQNISRMNLLSNLLEFSNYQPTSLMSCQSPKDLLNNKAVKEVKVLMSARKEECLTPQKKPASKSLSKLDLLSFSNTKIDPKQRLLHRMVHKLSMKCRKYYYNFFVVLQGLKKNNIQMKDSKLGERNRKVQSGVAKISQVQQILFSKYFQNLLKKSSFQLIQVWSRHKTAVEKVRKIFSRKYVENAFKQIGLFGKKREKQQIRVQILIDSINHIERSITHFHRIIYLQSFISNLKQNLNSYKLKIIPTPPQSPQQSYQTPSKISQSEIKIANTKPFTEYSPFSKDKGSFINPSNRQSYENLKIRKRIIEDSPGKPKQPIILACQQVKLKIQKCFNFIKNTKVKTNVKQDILIAKFNDQPQYQICKRCEPIALNSYEVQDLSDRSTIFFAEAINHFQVATQKFQIAQSTVKNYSVPLSEVQSEQLQSNSNSQVTLIAPLNQNYQEPRRSISSSGVKGSAFGSEAVNFKNSLVIERELMKNQGLQQKLQSSKKQANFAKIKNQVKSEKKTHDEYAQLTKYKCDSRYDSANKEYSSLKYKRQTDYTLNLPPGATSYTTTAVNSSRLTGNFTKRSCQTPEPQLRSNYTSERKHLSLVNNNKINSLQEDGRKGSGATYLRILGSVTKK